MTDTIECERCGTTIKESEDWTHLTPNAEEHKKRLRGKGPTIMTLMGLPEPEENFDKRRFINELEWYEKPCYIGYLKCWSKWDKAEIERFVQLADKYRKQLHGDGQGPFSQINFIIAAMRLDKQPLSTIAKYIQTHLDHKLSYQAVQARIHTIKAAYQPK